MDDKHLFDILNEIAVLEEYCDRNKSIFTPENYKIIQEHDPKKFTINNRTGQIDETTDYCKRVKNIWILTRRNGHKNLKGIPFNHPIFKVQMLELFHDYIDKQNRLKYIYETYGTADQIHETLNKNYEVRLNKLEKPKPETPIPETPKPETVYKPYGLASY
jgi:hypothetical protein